MYAVKSASGLHQRIHTDRARVGDISGGNVWIRARGARVLRSFPPPTTSCNSRSSSMLDDAQRLAMGVNDSYIILLAHFCSLMMFTLPLTIHVTIDLPPPKRRRTLASSIASTALSAALLGTAVGLTVFRL